MNTMLVPLLYASLGINCITIFICGALVTSRVGGRITGRLKSRTEALETVQSMETKRLKHDFGRIREVRENAGPPAQITRMPKHKKSKSRYR